MEGPQEPGEVKGVALAPTVPLVPFALMPYRVLFCSHNQHQRTHRLTQVAHANLGQNGTPHDVLALTVHQSAVATLRATLHATTGRQVATATVRQHALELLETFPQHAALPAGWNRTALMSGIERRMLIRHAWSGVGSHAGSLWTEHGAAPGALDWVARLFDQFSVWSATADPQRLPTLTLQHPQLAELWQAYHAYLALCHAHGLLAFSDIFGRATDVLLTSGAERPQLRVLVLDDLDLLGPAEWTFVGALVSEQTHIVAACANAPADTNAVDRMRALHHWMITLGIHVEHLEAQVSIPQPGVAEYPSPEAEAEAIAERIAADAPDCWSDYAVAAFDPELVASLQRTLPRRGVPVAGQNARDGYTILLAPLARVGLKLLAGQPLTPVDARTLLRSPALDLSPADARVVSQACAQGWLFDGAAPAGLSDQAQVRIEQVQQATAAAWALHAPPSVQLQHWLDALDLPQACWQHTAAALPEWAVAVDREQWQRIWIFLERAEQLATALATPLTPADALDVFDAAQALVVPQGEPLADAVQLWQPGELGGCTARHVFVAGLHEGALPQPIDALPFDDDALHAFAALPAFVAPQTTDHAAAWERGMIDLERVLGCAGQSVQLSYSRTDRGGRRRLPSPVVRGWGIGVGEQEKNQEPEIENQRQPATVQHSNLNSSFDARPSLLARISQSALEDYFICPRRAFYARQLKLYDVAAAPRQALGQVVHRALRELAQSNEGAMDVAATRALIERHWIRDVHVWGSRLKQAIFQQLAERAVMQQVRYESERGGTATTLGCEVRFEWALPDSDIVITGQIDRVDRDDDGLHIIDYKLGQTSPSLNLLLGEFVPPPTVDGTAWRPGDIQLPIYALAVEHGHLQDIERLPGERVASVALVYPLALYNDNGRASTTGVRRIEIIDHSDDCPACSGPRSSKTAYLCRQQLAAVLELARAAISSMRAHHWPPDPREGARTCGSCPFRPICPAPR